MDDAPLTLTGQLLQDRLEQLNIDADQFWGWTYDHHLEAAESPWSRNSSGPRVSADDVLVPMALRLRIDPALLLLTAAADRSASAFRHYFLAARQRYEDFPMVLHAWAALAIAHQQQGRGRHPSTINEE